MRLAAVFEFLILSVLCLASTPVVAQPGLFGIDDYTGSEIYLRFCASCHGDFGRGDGPVAATMAARVPNLTRIVERNDGVFPADALREIIDGRFAVMAHGPREMPVWGFEFWWEAGADRPAEETTRDTIDKLLEFLRSIQERP